MVEKLVHMFPVTTYTTPPPASSPHPPIVILVIGVMNILMFQVHLGWPLLDDYVAHGKLIANERESGEVEGHPTESYCSSK